MADSRKPEYVFLLRRGGKTTMTVELFPACLWPQAEGAADGLWRVRVDGRWLCDGRRHTFFTLAAAMAWCGRDLAGDAGPGPCPVARGDRVRKPNGNGYYDKTIVDSEPILGWDGRWWTTVCGRKALVPADELEVV